MSRSNLPGEVTSFIAEYIHSVLQLEILLLLWSARDRQWSGEQIDAELRINREWVAEQLDGLCRRHLLVCRPEKPPTYQYAPADPKVDAAIGSLADWYSTHRVAIIGVIHSTPTDKLRLFADAFRIRKEKPDA